ncbi:mechanosensitive ion channel family protein [Pseudomonadota bacterium]
MIRKTTRPVLFRFAFCQVLALLLLGFMGQALAAEAVKPDALPQAQATLKQIARKVAVAETASAEQLKTLKKEIAAVRSDAQDCVQEAEPKIQVLDSELAILQPAPTPATQSKTATGAQATDQSQAPVSPAIARQIRELQDSKASLQERIDTCKLMLLNSDDLDSDVDDYLRSLEKRQLLTRGASLVSVIQASLDEQGRWKQFTGPLAETSAGWGAIRPVYLFGAAGFGLLGLSLGFILGHILPHRLQARMARMKIEEKGFSGALAEAIMSSAFRYAPVVLALGGIIAYVTFYPSPAGDLRFPITILYSLLAYFVLAALIRALLNPCPPAAHYLPLPVAIAIPLSHRSRVLAMVVLFRWLVQELHADGLLDDTMYTLIREIIGIVWVLNVIWVCWLLRRIEGGENKWVLLLLLGLALSGGMVAGWIGYFNLGALVIFGITASLLLLGLTLVLGQFFSDLFDGFDEGRFRWQKAVRRSMGLKDQDYVPGLGWLRLVVNLVLWLGAGALLLRVWDPNEDITAEILAYFTEGFQIANLTIVPTHLLWSLIVLALLLTLTDWLKGRLDTKWLVKTRMEPSSREALVTSFGYVAMGIAALVALSVAGISFSNLAIIAGALSVGIGFGLQNVVNNFVSGIILLVERPVRNGDWIIVGNTEGYVQRISIRSTTLRTFDRADVIVPNSDLISGQVTNWTLGNTWGRAKVQVGVAYGSDVEAVIAILLDVASKHPEVFKGDPQVPDPYVLFLDFGDSSLDFELRAIIQNINRRLHVISDLNRAINTEFNKHGIEIPFPQRDVNFRGPLKMEPDSTTPPQAPESGELPQK